MKDYLDGEAGNNTQQKQVNASLARMFRNKDHKKKLRRFADDKRKPLFRWRMRVDAPVEEGNVVPIGEMLKNMADEAARHPTEPCQCIIPPYCRYVLQLKVDREVRNSSYGFRDYLYIAWSERRLASLGLFTCKVIHKDTVIASYSGVVRWISTIRWGGPPSAALIDPLNLGTNEDYSLTCRRSDGRMNIIDPAPVPNLQQRNEDPPHPPVSLFMGVHYVNDAEESLEGDARRRNAFHQNCEIVEDGLLVATKKIPANTELLCAYNRSGAPSTGRHQSATRKVYDSSDDSSSSSDDSYYNKKPAARKHPPSTGRHSKV